MDPIAFLLKSYRPDLAYARRLTDSFRRWNVAGLPLYCVVPSSDVGAFASLKGDGIHVLSEDDLLGKHLVREPIGGVSTGYANQEIVKLAFAEAGLAKNYFTVDSEAVFLRPFNVDDFMHDDATPYTVLVEDLDLKVEPAYYRQHWLGRERAIRRIMDEVGLREPVVRTCHGHQVLSGEVLGSFREEFLAPRGWTYADAIACSPYEFSWYCMWLQKARPIDIHQREPFVKVFHNEQQHLSAILSGVTDEDIARGYLAVVVNSNYSRDLGMASGSASKPELLAPYLSYKEVGSLVMAKARDTARRRLRRG